MAIIDLVKWTPQGNFNIYAYKFPETNLSTYTQLIVQESQEAILFSDIPVHQNQCFLRNLQHTSLKI